MPENPAREAAKTLRLAEMDFFLVPTEQIKAELKIKSNALNLRRQTPLYKETVEELAASWKQRLMSTPATNELRKKVNYGLSIAITKLIGILASSKTANRDIVAAARLMAQMDGRFIGSETGDGEKSSHDTESLAQELITAIKRDKETVQ